ncbi:uncharacterized protein RSE6_14430 [Rhynchosporium secalis]|uniref:DUF7888 domain-containing protein n=1 Tax=Rhynchosporium secalis TaxID=38038 RepID=A0A1E1MVA4_RHYSE|nr:uncharacterized protein RSE6_14430 [Rhynchosporium secalis]
MFFSKTLIALTVGFVAFSTASPVVKRGIVQTDTGKANIKPAIVADKAVIDVNGSPRSSADVGGTMGDIVIKVIDLVQGLVDKDLERRRRFTQETTASIAATFPGKTVVMSNVGYSLSCTPEALTSTKYKAKVGSDVSYDVLIIGAGCKFNLEGDGGFENWAYVPAGTCKGDGKAINC